MIEFGSAFEQQMLPKAFKHDFKKSLKFRCRFRSSFWSDFVSNFARFCSRPNHDLTAIYSIFVGCNIFREVGEVPKTDTNKSLKMIPNQCKIASKIAQKTNPKKRAKTHQKLRQNGAKQPPRISRKIPQIAPEAPRDVPGDPWDPQRTPKGPHTSQKDVQRAQKVTQRTPNDSQKTPRDALRIHKGLRKATKKAFNGHPKGTKTQNRKSMQPSSPQRLHRRNSQTTLRRKRSRPCGMRGALNNYST